MLGQVSHNGTIYIVAGSSGKTWAGIGEPHEAMRNTMALSVLGSLVVDVNKHVMDVVFLNSEGGVNDEFRITKGDIIFYDGFE